MLTTTTLVPLILAFAVVAGVATGHLERDALLALVTLLVRSPAEPIIAKANP